MNAALGLRTGFLAMNNVGLIFSSPIGIGLFRQTFRRLSSGDRNKNSTARSGRWAWMIDNVFFQRDQTQRKKQRRYPGAESAPCRPEQRSQQAMKRGREDSSLIGGCDEPIHERSCHQFGGKSSFATRSPQIDPVTRKTMFPAWILERLDLQRDFCRVDHGSGFHRNLLNPGQSRRDRGHNANSR